MKEGRGGVKEHEASTHLPYIVSRASAHGRSIITRDFQRTGRLPGILGAYHV